MLTEPVGAAAATVLATVWDVGFLIVVVLPAAFTLIVGTPTVPPGVKLPENVLAEPEKVPPVILPPGV